VTLDTTGDTVLSSYRTVEIKRLLIHPCVRMRVGKLTDGPLVAASNEQQEKTHGGGDAQRHSEV
jgi:hypothetical protein